MSVKPGLRSTKGWCTEVWMMKRLTPMAMKWSPSHLSDEGESFQPGTNDVNDGNRGLVVTAGEHVRELEWRDVSRVDF